VSTVANLITDTGPDAQGIDPYPTLGNARANQLVALTQMAAQMNAGLSALFTGAFNSWSISVNAGQTSNANPPKPPAQYVVSSPDAAGFQWPIIDPAGTPVCAMPPIPQDRTQTVAQFQATLKPNTIDVGKPIVGGGGKWFSVGPADTFACGSTTPPNTVAEDGTVGTFEKYGAPVGAGWYLKTA